MMNKKARIVLCIIVPLSIIVAVMGYYSVYWIKSYEFPKEKNEVFIEVPNKEFDLETFVVPKEWYGISEFQVVLISPYDEGSHKVIESHKGYDKLDNYVLNDSTITFYISSKEKKKTFRIYFCDIWYK